MVLESTPVKVFIQICSRTPPTSSSRMNVTQTTVVLVNIHYESNRKIS